MNEVPDLTLAQAAKPLLSLASVVWPHARRLYQERKAGRMPLARGGDILNDAFEETLSRLACGDIDDVWWRRLLNYVEHQYVTPDFLRKAAIREWLAEVQCQADIKTLARARVMNDENVDLEALGRVSAAYSEKTGEATHLADWPIEVVVAVLALGYLASIDQKLKPVVGMIQAVGEEARSGLSRVEQRFDTVDRRLDALGPYDELVEVQSERASSELSKIIKRRSVDPDRAIREIETLAERVSNGDLRVAASAVCAEVFHWAVRLNTRKPENLPAAKRYRSQLLEVSPQFETRIIDALIHEIEGDAESAFRMLRDLDDPDARATLFVSLSRAKGENAALSWFDEQPERNDTSFFTGIGWANLAVHLFKAERWEEAIDRIAAARVHLAEWPDLAFVEGVINCAMILPKELRLVAMEVGPFHAAMRPIEGPRADQLRARAEDSFGLAATMLKDIELDGRSQVANDWILWLQLTDSGADVAEAARERVKAEMKDAARAVELIHLAHAFDIPFDTRPLSRYVAQRKRLGGLEPQELVAEFVLSDITMPARDFANFLEREGDRLAQFISRAAVVGKRVEALAMDGQTARARRLLEERADDFSDYDRQRLGALISRHEGVDPRAQLERLYRETGELFDLMNLVSHVGQVGDWSALHPLLVDLFERHPTVENACRLVDCIRRDPSADDDSIVEFLEANNDLIDRSKDLAEAKAWALLHLGRWKEAKAINDSLLATRDEPNDLSLDINLAIQTGDWERFPVIIDREWPRREKHGAQTLLRLSSLAAETDGTATRALELATLAADRASDDPQILVGAYTLALQLGREEDVPPEWIAHASRLSTDDGPVWGVDMRTVIEEMVPAHRQRILEIERQILHGQIPIHVAAVALGAPMSRLLLDIPGHNVEVSDGRRRTVVPIVSGARQNVALEKEWAIGLDITSLMTLSHLELLGKAIDALPRVVLSPDTMILLLNERRRVRFHQPSRIRDAEQVRMLIDQGRLALADSSAKPPEWLIDEVGRDLAELLESARAHGGRVVRPRPIYRLGTFMEREAQLREYNAFVCPTTTFALSLYKSGRIDSEIYERASRYLEAHDKESNPNLDPVLFDSRVYLDDLAVGYLQAAGILSAACRCNIDLHVHSSMRAEQESTIAANTEGDALATKIDNLRTNLRGALETNKAVFLARRQVGDEDAEERGHFGAEMTLMQFLNDADQCNALCVDDRFVNRHLTMTDRNQQAVPIVCVLDLLRHLESREAIVTTERYAALHKLREAGFALVPMDFEELEWRLRAAQFDADGQLVESAELRVFRQMIMRIRSLDFIQQPLETPFLLQLQSGGALVIRRLWQDKLLPAERAEALSEWIWRNAMPSPFDWMKPPHEEGHIEVSSEALARHIGLVLKPMNLKDERLTAFQSWVERLIIEPLMPANSELVESVVKYMRSEIEVLIDELVEDTPSIAG